MTCEQCEENLLPYLDRELSPEETAEVDGHIRRCSHCQHELAELELFSRSMHNTTIPFRQAVENIETGLEITVRRPTKEHVVRRLLKSFESGRRTTLLWSGIATACAMVALFFLFRPHETSLDELAAWGIQHYPLVDQVHTIRGNADGVRTWFREHHGMEVTPPRRVNYAELTGCKMSEFHSQPAPLLKFEGSQTSVVFILPTKFSGPTGGRDVSTLSREGFHIELWGEEGNTYLRVSKSS